MTTNRRRALSALLATALLFITVVRADDRPAPATSPSKDQSNMTSWRDARFGMFIHWGLYAIPAGEWHGKPTTRKNGEWIMNDLSIPVAEYDKLADQWDPEKFDATRWAQIAKDAGMKYIILTSKHHEGFCLWNSAVTDYDVQSTPFKRDIVKELSDAARAQGLRFGLYYSIMDWHRPDAQAPNFPKYSRRGTAPVNPKWHEYVENYMKPQLKELLTNYGPIFVLWFDGEWIPEWTEEQGKDLYAFCKSIQPDVIINNRVGKGRKGMTGVSNPDDVGDFFTPEQQIPAKPLGGNWESCMTMNDTWGYRKDDTHWKPADQCIRMLIETVSKGGNLLLNVGPNAQGEIPPESIARLAEVGRWLKTNGDSIYGTEPGPFYSLAWARSTRKGNKVYVQVLDWPEGGNMKIPLRNRVSRAYLLAKPDQDLNVDDTGNGGVLLRTPGGPPDPVASVIVLEIEGKPDVIP